MKIQVTCNTQAEVEELLDWVESQDCMTVELGRVEAQNGVSTVTLHPANGATAAQFTTFFTQLLAQGFTAR